jgi:rod shape-determining protein MreD
MSFDKNSYAQDRGLEESFASAFRRTAIVAVQIAALMLLSAFPFNFWHMASVRPAFLLMAVYHWAVFRPQTLSPLAAFVAGILLDLLTAGPLGLNGLTLVSVQWFTKTQRRFLIGQSFLVLWLCFFLIALGAYTFQWAMFSLFSLALSPVRPMLAGAVITGLFFPPMAGLMNAFNKKLSGRFPSV